METLVNNRQVNIWRGSEPPPTIHHVWIKDNKTLFLYDTQYEDWVSFLEFPGLKVTQQEDRSIKISAGDTYFILATSGNSISMNKVGNTIMFVSNALSSIPTSSPLEWKNQKLKHLESGVQAGIYGPKLSSSSNTFSIPNFQVNQTGHITKADQVSVTIPDRVVQNPLSEKTGKFQVILSGSNSEERETGEVNKINTFFYDTESKQVYLPSIIVEGNSEINGVTVFNANIKLGKNAVIEGSVTGTATPTNHASTEDVFGLGTASTKDPAKYGHVKLETTFEKAPNNDLVQPVYQDGVAASPVMVFEAYQAAITYSDNLFGSDFRKEDGKYMIDWLEI